MNDDDTPMAEHTDSHSHKTRTILRIARLPWTLLLTIYLLVVYIAKIDLSADGLGNILGYVYFGLGLVILFVQFFKSADISSTGFIVHLTGALLSMTVATVLMTLLLSSDSPETHITFHYWYGCTIILADAVLSPFNSFRTAKRNFAVGEG
ncbi:MAG: hypothetical protein ACI9X0_000287 [Kiritimatiellia bacterium]|jgi:hypothetical protein